MLGGAEGVRGCAVANGVGAVDAARLGCATVGVVDAGTAGRGAVDVGAVEVERGDRQAGHVVATLWVRTGHGAATPAR